MTALKTASSVKPSAHTINVYVRTRLDTVRTVPDAFVAVVQDVSTNPGDMHGEPCEWTFAANGIEYTITARDVRPT